MKKIITASLTLIIIIIIMTIILGGISNITQNAYVEISSGEMIEKIENRDTFVVYFYQEYCNSCEQVQPILNSYIKDSETTIYAINLNETEYPGYLAEILKIQGSPTIISYVDGIEAGRLSTVFTYDELKSCIQGEIIK